MKFNRLIKLEKLRIGIVSKLKEAQKELKLSQL